MKLKILTSLALYSSTSYFFLLNPHYLHDCSERGKRLRMPSLPEGQKQHVIAHRGGSMESPENTLQGFKQAVKSGASMIETDVRMTRDGVIIVCHDDNFHRLCGLQAGDALVSQTDFKDLPKFREQMSMHFSKNQKYQLKDGDQNFYSTLEEVFQVLPREVVIQIELKDSQNQVAQRELVRLIQRYQRQKTTIIGSSKEKDTLELHQLDQTIPKFMSGDAAIKYMLLYLCGLLPFTKIDHHEVAALPFMTRDYLRMKLFEAKTISWVFYPYIAVVSLGNRYLDGMIQHFNKRGIHTNFWVINDDDEVKHLIKTTSIAGIMTDRPRAVREIIRKESNTNIEKFEGVVNV